MKKSQAELDKLKERASQAFDTEFRDRLASAVQAAVFQGTPVQSELGCYCPEGCLRADWCRPAPYEVIKHFGFTITQHRDFQHAFDMGSDRGTPEAALGLLYRERFT